MRAASFALGCLIPLAFCSAAVAGDPFHSPLEDPIGGYPLNHACGTAVDSQADIYVSNAGESKVEVFDSSGGHLTSIANANEPCGLAVDSQGTLYVSERATGEVVRYVPNAYPFSGTPTYGAPATIDASGNAKGIAVDPTDDSLYVAKGSRVDTYEPNGVLGRGEAQRVRVDIASGTFTLTFKGQTTVALAYNASHAEVQAALEALSSIGPENVEVTQFALESANLKSHLVTFTGALGGKDVEQITGSPGCCFIATSSPAFDGHIGEGELGTPSGVAVHTYGTATTSKRRYLSVADVATDEIKVFVGRFDNQLGSFLPGTLEPRATIDGSETPAGELGLAAEAYLGVDASNGHLFAFDATNEFLNEFEAGGRYFTRIEDEDFEDASPTAVAVDRSGGASEGRIYATAGAGAGAKLLAFKAVVPPDRLALPKPPSGQFPKACGTAVDSAGNLYVAGETRIAIYPPEPELDPESGEPAPTIEIDDSGRPCGLAVDLEGNLYAVEQGLPGSGGDESVVVYEPSAYPPSAGTTYTKNPTPIETQVEPTGIAVNPANGRLFVAHAPSSVREYESAAGGSELLEAEFCGPKSQIYGLDVYGANGTVFMVQGGSGGREILACDAAGEPIASLDGSGSPGGPYGLGILNLVFLAVDQANGHVLVGNLVTRGVVEEFEASGAFVEEFGPFSKKNVPSDLAVDNSAGPTKGNLYVAYDAATGFDLSAFGPLSYGQPPTTASGSASGLGGTSATLGGTVNPNRFELTDCHFEYLLDSAYTANLEASKPAFEGAESVPCEASPAEIGQGSEPVAVKATVGGLQAQGRYRFRLVAENEFGVDEGDPVLFGPPVVETKRAQPILYREATLRGSVDPSGLATQYRFEYGPTEAYGQSTPTRQLPAASGPAEVEAPLTGLLEDTPYHFRLVAESEAGTVFGADEELRTLARPPIPPCPNSTLRLENRSSRLPDCRAYELVSAADVRGATPRGSGPLVLVANFNGWLVTPRGALAGESIAFYLAAALSPTEGSGRVDGYRATRDRDTNDDGAIDGWRNTLFAPSFEETGDRTNPPTGIASDQLYSFWSFGSDLFPEASPEGSYLGTPTGFEPIGIGSLGIDLDAQGRYLSAGASHVIFESAEHLEPNAPVAPLKAIYDRSPGNPTQVLSLLPGDVAPGSDATYEGATPDGSAVAFSVGGDLYLRRNGTETVEVADAPASFAGLSDDGQRVFYTDDSNAKKAAGLWAFDVEGQSTSEIAAGAKFVLVSDDGSHAYFVKEGDLYAWDGTTATSIAALDPTDFQAGGQARFPGTSLSDNVALDAWTAECVVVRNTGGIRGRADCPARATPDGGFLVFQSHADLTPPYEGNGHSQIYRYDAADQSILCVSCDPTGTPATADSDLQGLEEERTTATQLIPGIADDDGRVFFQTEARLLPEDANSVLDVYEWQAEGVGGCTRPQGCLALISSGQSDEHSYIYSMSADGEDVFFITTERLVGTDAIGSRSLYDARVEGGFPAEVAREPCHGDACQGEATPPPPRAAITTEVPGTGNATRVVHCRKGQRKVRRAGRARCVKRKLRHRKHRRHAKQVGGGAR